MDVSGATFRVPQQELIRCPWADSPPTAPVSAPADPPSLPPSLASQARSTSMSARHLNAALSPIFVAEHDAYEVHPVGESHGPNPQLVDPNETPLGCVRLSGDSSVVSVVTWNR